MRIASFASVACVAVAFACGGSNNTNVFDTDGGGGGSNGDGGGGGGGSFTDGGTTGNLGGDGSSGTTGDGCSDAAKLIYVLSAQNDLYSFDPLAKKFTKIGALGCQTDMTPNSMAISRDATAWVNYVRASGAGTDTAGSVFKVSTKDASCQPTTIALQKNWYRLGMGFSTDSATSTSETLFVAATGNDPLGIGGGSSPGLGKIDLGAMALTPIGGFGGNLDGQNAELTGTGDGRLFGFFIPPQQPSIPGFPPPASSPVSVAQIDKTAGAASGDVPLPTVEIPGYWAFSFWGGDFYLYTAPGPDATNPTAPTRTSNVTRYRPSDGSVDTSFMTEIGFQIVGAGVSTCAPVQAPK